jgi:hypothetical protein
MENGKMPHTIEEVSEILYEELMDKSGFNREYGIPGDDHVIMSLPWTGSSERLKSFTHQEVLDAAHCLVRQGLVVKKSRSHLFRATTPIEIVAWKKNQSKI